MIPVFSVDVFLFCLCSYTGRKDLLDKWSEQEKVRCMDRQC